MPICSATRRHAQAETSAAIDRRFDQLARIARQLADRTPQLAGMLAAIEQQRGLLQARARAEIAARRDFLAGGEGGAQEDCGRPEPYWCDACAEPGSSAVCAYCTQPTALAPIVATP